MLEDHRSNDIHTVHMIFMNHLDIGYTTTVNNVLNEYIHQYFQQVEKLGDEMRELEGTDRFVYLTHPWLMSLFFDCPCAPTPTDPNATCPARSLNNTRATSLYVCLFLFVVFVSCFLFHSHVISYALFFFQPRHSLSQSMPVGRGNRRFQTCSVERRHQVACCAHEHASREHGTCALRGWFENGARLRRDLLRRGGEDYSHVRQRRNLRHAVGDTDLEQVRREGFDNRKQRRELSSARYEMAFVMYTARHTRTCCSNSRVTIILTFSISPIARSQIVHISSKVASLERSRKRHRGHRRISSLRIRRLLEVDLRRSWEVWRLRGSAKRR